MFLGLIVCTVLSVSSLAMSVGEPIVLGFLLLVNALCVSLVIGVTASSLLGFFVFLVYVGGVLVIFGYVISLLPNQLFSNLHFSFLGWLLAIFLVCLQDVPIVFGSGVVKLDILSTVDGVIVYLFMGVLLLLDLCVVVNMCFNEGLPLRSIV